MNRILVVGNGGLAQEFSSWFATSFDIAGYFIDVPMQESRGMRLPLFQGQVTPDMVSTNQAVIAIATPAAKIHMYDKLRKAGFSFPAIIHASSLVAGNVCIAEGVVISPHCVVSPNVTLERLAYLNFGCGIGHDARIGAFVQINPGTQIGGHARIDDAVLIGSGSTVLQKVSVGTEATVGAGSVVFGKVAAKTTVIGNPARRLRPFE